MKRLIEIAFLFVLGTGVAQAAGGIGGGGTICIVFDGTTHTLYVPGRLDERFQIAPSGSDADVVYTMSASDFAKLQATADSLQTVSAKGEAGGTRSYRVTSSDQDQLQLIDRRAAARNGVAQ